jgi:hypothetical protein
MVKELLEVPNETLYDHYLGLASDVRGAKNDCFKYSENCVWKRVQGWLEKFLSARGK